jgi:4-aminobutyrate aminotransferase-like enzyme/Ser/Thr protein kinase RdoA (MazF antagonist)
VNGRSDVFSAPAPALTIDELRAIAREQFSVGGVMSPLDSERDQNAYIDAGDQQYVLKVANVAEEPAVLDLQIAVLHHLAGAAPALEVPRVVTAVGGTPYATVRSVQGHHHVRLVTHLTGRPMATVERTPTLEHDLGRLMGSLSHALQGFGHPAAHRPDFLWHLDHAQAVRPWVTDIADDADRALAEAVFARHQRHVLPVLPLLRGAVVHHDANDHNVLVDDGRVSGLIDFGDMVFARQVNELAVTLAYALLDVPDIVATADRVIGAYTEQFALDELELSVLFDLVATRLAMSVAISSHRAREFPDNDYLLVSQAPALRLLRRLASIRPQFLHFVARHAAGLPAVPQHDALVAWMRSSHCRPVSPLPFDLRRAPRIVISLADGAPGTHLAGDPEGYWQWLQQQMAAADADVAIGRYAEDRNCYAGDQFTTDAPETRSVHLGIDLFVPEDTPVLAMLPGTVLTVQDNDAPYDYGPTVILRHEAHTTAGAMPFYVLYGHLSRRTLTTVRPGQQVAPGEVVGYIGNHTENGGWAPHVHVQVITDLMTPDDHQPDGNFEGAGEPSRMPVWRQIAPDADLLLRLGPETWADGDSPDQLLTRRLHDLGPSLRVSYRRPLSIARGEGTWLIDHTGRHYLDCVNNVCHVGHAHPHVVAALTRQAALLNTNTRYLHRTILDYAERLAATFPEPLSTVYFVNSGSEANELALRMARTVTGRHDVIAVDWGYHGNTNDLIEISAYKFNREGGTGRPAHVQLAELPDTYRGRLRLDGSSAEQALGAAYATSVAEAVVRATEHDPRGPAAFIAESIAGCGGQVVFPPGYLDAAYVHARSAGALCIADEVQVGFGRVGRAMWAFQLQGVVPDIVTLGKPMGNGHPLAAVVTTPQIASAFANGMELFNTFGGNPVSCAVGMAVLDVIEGEGLMARAADTGAHLVGGLLDLQGRHPAIGDVRGEGLYLGVDLVDDRQSRTPATTLAGDVAEHMRTRGVLISTDGPADNVLKIKPPIVFSRADADVLLAELDQVLCALSSQEPAPRRSRG